MTVHHEKLEQHVFCFMDRVIRRRRRRVLVALSGGPDSTVLAHLVDRWARDRGVAVVLAHFVHVWPATAEWERRWVEAVAKQLSRPLLIGHDPWIGVPAESRPRRIASEAALRRRRFRFLLKAAASVRTPWILLGHHRDDQVETILQRLIRGTGPTGLRGMRRVQPVGRFRLVRPMLGVPRCVLAAYRDVHGLHAFEDPTNRDRSRERNWIRHGVLPMITRRHPDFPKRLLRLSYLLTDEDRYLNRTVRIRMKASAMAPPPGSSGMWWMLDEFRDAEPPIQRRWLRIAYRRFYPEYPLQWVHIALVRRFLMENGPPGEVRLPGGVVVVRDRDRFGFRRSMSGRIDWSRAWNGAGVVEIPEAGVRITIMKFNRAARPNDFVKASRAGVYYLDADRVRPPGVWRSRRPGDRFQPLGMDQPVRLKRFFTARKIPYDSRWKSILLETERGIALVWPWEIAHWARVTGSTTSVWEVRFEHLKDSIQSGGH